MDVKEAIINGLAGSKRAIDRTLNGLTADEIKWQPRPDANSIGLILFHMIRSEDESVQSRLQSKPQLWESEKWYQKLNKDAKDTGGRYTEEQCAAFVVPDLKDLTAYAEAVRQKTLEYLKGLAPAILDTKPNLPPDSPPIFKDMTIGAMLMMNVTHFAQHAGEISYIRGLKRGLGK